MGGLTGGDAGGIFTARRGIEKVLFRVTIALSVLFFILAISATLVCRLVEQGKRAPARLFTGTIPWESCVGKFLVVSLALVAIAVLLLSQQQPLISEGENSNQPVAGGSYTEAVVGTPVRFNPLFDQYNSGRLRCGSPGLLQHGAL